MFCWKCCFHFFICQSEGKELSAPDWSQVFHILKFLATHQCAEAQWLKIAALNHLIKRIKVSFFNPHPRHFLLLFRKRQEEAERERLRERNIDMRETLISCLLELAPTGDRTHNLGACPDWESNLSPISLWVDASTNRAAPARDQNVFLQNETND